MAETDGIYKCEICGNVVSVIEGHQGELVCCGKPMVFQQEKNVEQEGKEKHVPILENLNGQIIVKVGSVEHPMEEKHYIELIELLKDGKVIASKKLTFNDKPEATFCMDGKGITARIYCNVHGLWA
jgi:superoxide reductase